MRENWQAVPLVAWLSLAFVIVGPTVVAYLLNAWALGRADSSLVAIYTYLQPFIAAILAAVFLAETLRPAAILAGLLIFAGVFLSSRVK
jgi:drug/metabolite transporter (DMT)-like permease